MKVDSLIFVILASLATFRIAEFVSLDDAPFGLMDKTRLYLGKKAAGAKKYSFWWSAAELVNCPYCVGIWAALLIVIIFRPDNWFLYWLAIAGGQSWLESMSRRE